MAQQQLEQLGLAARELEVAVAAARRAGLGLEGQVGEGQPLLRRAVAAQQRAQPRAQLLALERLDEVVVGAGVEAGDALLERVARGQQEDRHGEALGAQAARDGEAVDAGHGHVEHEDVGHRALDRGERGAAVGDGAHA